MNNTTSLEGLYRSLIETFRSNPNAIQQTRLWKELDSATKANLISLIRSKKRKRKEAKNKEPELTLGLKIKSWIKQKEAVDPDELLRKTQFIILIFSDFWEPSLSCSLTAMNAARKYMVELIEQAAEANRAKSKLRLKDIAKVVPNEVAECYFRWRLLRLQVKASSSNAKDFEERHLNQRAFEPEFELSDLNSRFKDRLSFLDRQTKLLDADDYLSYAKLRSCTQLASNSKSFKAWLCPSKDLARDAVELISFVVYDTIAALTMMAKSYCASNVSKEVRCAIFPILEQEFMAKACSEWFSTNSIQLDICTTPNTKSSG